MARGADGSIHARILTTFSENAEATRMYEHPEIIIEQVRAYYQQGYRHFLYVAQAPYTSTLHLPSSDARTELYFMNESVIQAMRQVGEGTKVYPIFCDRSEEHTSELQSPDHLVSPLLLEKKKNQPTELHAPL